MLMLFLKGLLIGLAIAAPIGPIGILCIQRTLHEGFKVGLLTGLGAASADGIYGLIVGFGLTSIANMLMTHQFFIRLLGGLFLIYLGIKLLTTPYRERVITLNTERSLWHAYTTAFFLTLTNPMTILSFTAVFAAVGIGDPHVGYAHALSLVIGIISGSAIWSLILSGSIAFILHHRISSTTLRLINRISGIIILAFGIFALKV